MYIGVIWERVNSIKGIYMIVDAPNTYSYSFLVMYYDVLLLQFIPAFSGVIFIARWWTAAAATSSIAAN